MSDPRIEREGGTALAPKRRTKRPRRWQVLLHNDDYTTMDFVIEILMRHFGKSDSEATHVMLQVHVRGHGVAGVFTRDVAETKVALVTAEARAEGMPLLVTAEPEGASDGARDENL